MPRVRGVCNSGSASRALRRRASLPQWPTAIFRHRARDKTAVKVGWRHYRDMSAPCPRRHRRTARKVTGAPVFSSTRCRWAACGDRACWAGLSTTRVARQPRSSLISSDSLVSSTGLRLIVALMVRLHEASLASSISKKALSVLRYSFMPGSRSAWGVAGKSISPSTLLSLKPR